MASLNAAKQTICPPKSDFTVDSMPDLTGQVMIVTGKFFRLRRADLDRLCLAYSGGNAGLGRETIKVTMFLEYVVNRS